MNPIGGGTKKICPGRCNRCGCLMVLVRLHDDLGNIEPFRRVGWRCLVCGRSVDLHSMVRRQERPLYKDFDFRSYPQGIQVQHG